MCRACWEERGTPRIKSARVRALVPLIRRVYDFDCVGGNLHVVLEDWNIEDEIIAQCWGAIVAEESQLKAFAEVRCMEALLSCTLKERASALALYQGFIE